LPDAAFAAAFAPNASHEEQALLASVQRPISAACLGVPMDRPRWTELPSWFLVAEQDIMILPETQRFMANRMQSRVRAHMVDHAPLVTAPAAVADLIREAAREIR
jgi:pimeloyl-ACP methyl ester carboxylesterase